MTFYDDEKSDNESMTEEFIEGFVIGARNAKEDNRKKDEEKRKEEKDRLDNSISL